MDKPAALIPQLNTDVREQLKKLVLDSLVAAESKRAYGRAMDNFLHWFETERPSAGFTKATVQAYRSMLIKSGLSSSTVSLNMTAIRKLANEASDNGLIAADLAAAIGRVKGVKRHGLRIGTWLTVAQAEALLSRPNMATLKGKRDRAILALLLGSGLRRDEAARLTLEHIQQRSGRWVIVDILGKGGRVRSVPIPPFTKEAIDMWTEAAGLHTGRVFRSMNKGGKVVGDKMSAQSIFDTVKHYGLAMGSKTVSCHNLRRSYARLAHDGKAPLEQIQTSLGHQSILVTQSYVGVLQDLTKAPCDYLNIKMRDSTS
jgi:site-specific recombinase XerD